MKTPKQVLNQKINPEQAVKSLRAGGTCKLSKIEISKKERATKEKTQQDICLHIHIAEKRSALNAHFIKPSAMLQYEFNTFNSLNFKYNAINFY